MSQVLAIRRRRPRPTPMRSLRVGAALRGAAPAARAFPGIEIPEPSRGRRRVLSSGVSLVLHAGLISLLLFCAWMNPVVKEQPIPVQLVKEEPAPPPPLPKPKQEAAPAPRAFEERRSLGSVPGAQALRPQVVNPTVITTAAPLVTA